jgi:PAS domain S-box-containing protein
MAAAHSQDDFQRPQPGRAKYQVISDNSFLFWKLLGYIYRQLKKMIDESENINPRREKILLIDDDADMREYGRRLLEHYEFEVWEAIDGRHGLEIVAKRKPDLIIADVMMPRLDGLELLKILRSDDNTREIPVILLSARYGEDARIEGMEAGADDYVEKPFSANELLARIKAHLKMARVRADAANRERRLRMQAELAETSLREKEERLRLVLESVIEYGIITTDDDGTINSWNRGAEKTFGWTAGEALGQSIEIIFTPEDRGRKLPEKERQRALKIGRAEDERWHLCKDGSRIFVSGVMSPLKDSYARGFVKIVRDQTEKMKAEKALRDREIMQKIVGAQELERKRLARDLHDELGQQLTVLRLRLEQTRKICGDNNVGAEIAKIQDLIGEIDDGVDFLAWELRPTVLDDLGLFAALDKYVHEWSQHSGIRAELIPTGLKSLRLAPEVETNLYRIAQEALNNTNKHAQATHVEVVVKQRGDEVILIIADDGKGFDLNNRTTLEKEIGLNGMRERAILIGGSLEIESAPGSGTTIYVRVPALFVESEDKTG